ncbi:uncharacterized protein LOC135133069 [Zophobas morio]|uniref:uncharacterized protein LOC135133069 n=1 Tax=Zophobas morio TaxID=2755281 RepID=UPI0030833AAB
MGDLKGLITNLNFILKIIEFILLLIAVIIWATEQMTYGSLKVYTVFNSYPLVVTASATWLMITLIFIIVYIAGDTKPIFEMLFIGCGFLMNIIGGFVDIIFGIKEEGNFAAFLVPIMLLLAGALYSSKFVLRISKDGRLYDFSIFLLISVILRTSHPTFSKILPLPSAEGHYIPFCIVRTAP